MFSSSLRSRFRRSSGSGTGSNNVVGLQHATTGSPPTTLLSFNLRQSGYGCDFMSPICAASPETQSALAPVTSSERFELLNIDVLSRLVVNGAGEIGAILTAT
jgi:hypothetical protein